MKAISWEDKKLTTRQQEILIGSLLGDGRLECRSLRGSARLRIHHADSQRALLLWKYREFQYFVHREPWCTDWYDRRYGCYYRSWFFHTETSIIFRRLYTWFYHDGRKRIPENIAHDLTPLALAVWIADDGCRENGLILNTQSFNLGEQKVLLNALWHRYAIEGSINRDRKNFRLRFNTTNTDCIRRILRPFSIPILNEKLVPVTTAPKFIGAMAVAQ